MPLKVGLVVAGLAAGLALLIGAGPWVALIFGAIGWVSGYETAFRLHWFDQEAAAAGLDLSSSAPPLMIGSTPSIDLGSELADLLRSAELRTNRTLEDTGTFGPFVMYEEAGGSVRIRTVDTSDPARTAMRARDAARSIENAVRVVIVLPAHGPVKGKERPVVMYEAAERRLRDRTLTFVQPWTRRKLVVPAGLQGRPIYVGDAPHSLRPSEAFAGQG